MKISILLLLMLTGCGTVLIFDRQTEYYDDIYSITEGRILCYKTKTMDRRRCYRVKGSKK
jgi:uncharacterized protein YceK